MFNKAIIGAALASDAADRLFSNITATDAPDQSFLVTLRALLRKRLPQDESVRLICRGLDFSELGLMAVSPSQRMSLIIPDAFQHSITPGHSIYIVHAAHSDAGAKMLETIKAGAGKGKRHMSNYNRRDDLQVFYARKVDALFYTDIAEQNTVIFVDKLELKHFHALQMMIPKYLPALFSGNPLTEMETALLKSTGNKSAVEYETLIEEFAKDLDIRAEIIRSKLAGFETVFERMRADEIKDEISGYQSNYEHYLSLLRDISNKIQERRYTLAGLESAIKGQSGDSELMEYFMCNKNLSIIRVAGTAIEFIAHGYADVYDEDAFDRYVGNLSGYMYAHLNPSITKPQMEKLYRAIFSEGRYKLRICAAYRADVQNGLVGLRQYVFPPESRTYLHNPHIQNHGCIGNYAGRFQEYMQKRDYVGAIDQAVVSARNLNFYDSTVMGGFARDLSRTAISCIERFDGTLLTPREAIIELEGGDPECLGPLF